MNELELIKYQHQSFEKAMLRILKDINDRMNRIEDKVMFISEETDKLMKGLR